MKNIAQYFIACSLILVSLTACTSRSNLYEITDSFVETLATTKESYRILETGKEKKISSDKRYQVMPTGRIIIVKFLDYVEKSEYENLKEDLESHYSGDKRVNDVYINQGGTVVVDCRP